MAKKMSANGSGDDGPSKGHNVADLKKLICECTLSAVEIKKERGELNERMADIRKRLREAGAEPKAFDFAVRVREMESETQGNYIDQLRVCFEALSIGSQSDMFAGGDGGSAGAEAGAQA